MNAQFLDINALPVVAYQHAPHVSRSDKYAHVPSIDVIKYCERDLGLGLAQFQASRVRKQDKQGFQGHVMRFRALDSVPSLHGVHSEIVMRNAHDGSKAWQIMAGKFRLVCANGMVVMSENHGRISFGHRGDNLFDRIKNAVTRLMETSTMADRLIDGWARKQLTGSEILDFAQLALNLKYGESAPISARDLYQTKRPEDESQDAWTVFNVIQESLIRGVRGINPETGKVKTVRAIKSPDKDLAFNAQLWGLAEKAFA